MAGRVDGLALPGREYCRLVQVDRPGHRATSRRVTGVEPGDGVHPV